MVLDISTPEHEKYGKHMSRRDLKELLQPRKEVSDSIVSWLEEEGVAKRSIQDDGDWIQFVVSVSQAEKMLKTRFYYYHDSADPRISMIRTLKYSVPAHLAPSIHMIQPTTKFGKPRKHGNSIARLEAINLANITAVNCNSSITPKCLRDLYKMGNALAKPDSRNVLGISGYLDQYARYGDFYKFIKLYAPELKGANFSVEHIGNGLNLQNSTRSSIEASLDIDYALGLSNATGVFYTTAGRGPLVPELEQPDQEHNSNEPYLDQLHYLLSLPSEKLPAILSTSYGENEQSVPEKFSNATCSLFAQLGARGVSVIFSSGDSGVGSSCLTNGKKKITRFNPTFPASCPFVTSVGATYRINPERAISFSSGGFSDRHARPKYQNDAVQDYLDELSDRWKGLYNPSGRGIPDISAQGANFAIHDHGKVTLASGTSASAPAFAAIVANLNTIRLEANKSVLGYLNPFIYGRGRRGFTDIIHGGSTGCLGDNTTNVTAPAVPYASWNATEGWDPVTGVGTPNFEILAKIVRTMS
ncbi:tripeptidyl peptidase SED3 [Arthroderma uncinatum]|uniref:tripeptidyl peptidase SED3 n=1 Tax=Arthroderma uncinatum TaxID=74035 RepID=UPI00144A9AE7|nr:tripeptidyl peptidase SED3 [Arthroderma uncinatum]KAF3492192.1 tripeptidyl peptidase SED3 [Arthroderma uncinatum]